MSRRRASDISPAAASRWLLIKPKMIGDTLLAIPAIQAARRAQPGLRIDVLVRTGSEGVLAGCPGIERVLLTVPPDDERRTRVAGGLRRWLRQLLEVRYDVACDLTGTERGHFTLMATRARRKLSAPATEHLHQAWIWRRVIETLEIEGWDSLHAIERDAAVISAVLGKPLEIPEFSFPVEAASYSLPPLPSRYAVVHPASRVAAKRWPEDRWRAIVAGLTAQCGHVVLSCGPATDEVSLARRIASVAPQCTTVSAGLWPWAVLAAVIRDARVFVGADTAAAHLAAAVGTPSVVVWGPSQENTWAPWSDRCWLVVEDRIVPAGATRRQPPNPVAMIRSTAANQTTTVEEAIRLALG